MRVGAGAGLCRALDRKREAVGFLEGQVGRCVLEAPAVPGLGLTAPADRAACPCELGSSLHPGSAPAAESRAA